LVDAVILFDEQTPLKLTQSLQPDVLVKGADSSREDIVGAAEVRSWGQNNRGSIGGAMQHHKSSGKIERHGDHLSSHNGQS